eukprot:scaffold2323_cov329-Prasinococcus_capsulatus_cf.AAC.5
MLFFVEMLALAYCTNYILPATPYLLRATASHSSNKINVCKLSLCLVFTGVIPANSSVCCKKQAIGILAPIGGTHNNNNNANNNND